MENNEQELYRNHNQGIISGRFCIIRTLSEDGGTSIVKQGYDLTTNKMVAIKIMRGMGQ